MAQYGFSVERCPRQCGRGPRLRSRRFAAGALCAAALALHAAAPRAQGETLIAAIPRDSPPQYLLDRDGRPSGFAIELMAPIARRAGVEVVYRVEDNWADAIESLRAGRADLIPSLGVTEARRQWFAFTSPLETFRISLFVRSDSHTIAGWRDLGGRTVAAVRSNAAAALLQDRKDFRLELFPDFPEALFALLSGNVDALVYPEPWAWQRARSARLAYKIKIVGQPLTELKRALAVRASERALLARMDSAVRAVVKTPAYRAIYTKWIAGPEPFWNAARLAVAMSLLLLLVAAGMGTWRYLGVYRLNRNLRQALAERERAEARYRAIFDISAVSLWEEDIGQVRELIETHRRAGVDDWLRYCRDNPRFVEDCSQALRVVDVNPATLRLYEAATKEELFGSITRLFTDEARELFMRELAAIAAGERRFTAETSNYTLLGRRIEVVIALSIPTPDSPSQRMVAVIVDVTERKRIERRLAESEIRLRTIVDHEPQCVKLLALDGTLLEMNAAGLRMIEADTAQQVLGQPVLGLVAEAHRAAFLALNRRVAAGEAAELQFEIVGLKGTRRWLETHAVPFRDAEGRVIALLGVTADITEKKRAELEREQLLAELKARNVEMENFVYSISHDLKAPLVTISGFARLLDRDVARGDRAAVADSLAEIQRAAHGMHALIEDLLTLSRSGQIVGELEELDLTRLIEELRARCAAAIEQAEASVHIATALPRIRVDPGRFGQVLQNLIDNALRYRRAGVRSTVEIGAEARGRGLGIYVRDNGIGIKKEYQEKIFGLFQRLDPTTEGTGVGLAIARRIVEMHGGRLTVESEPGVGSTFWIELPDSAIVSPGRGPAGREAAVEEAH